MEKKEKPDFKQLLEDLIDELESWASSTGEGGFGEAIEEIVAKYREFLEQ